MLEEMVKDLAEARLQRGAISQNAEEIQRALAKTALGQELQAAHVRLSEAKERVNALEALVRAEAVAETERTGDKKPTPGVTVKACTTLVYEDDRAKHWAIKTYIDALRLDKRAFEKAAKVLKPGFVRVHESFKAYISRDLSGALAKAQKEAGDGTPIT